jgi:hypothetical protein
MLLLGCESRRLPPHQLPQAGKGAHCLEPQRRELSSHGDGRWSGLRRNENMQENKRQRRWAQDDRRMEVWIRMTDSTPYLSSLASGSPSGAALGAHTAHPIYPGADKGAQVPSFSQHRPVKWWPSGAKTKRPTHPICVASRRFGNRGHDCLTPYDFCCIVTAHKELQRVTVPPGALSVTASRANRGLPHAH